ncbi:MAG: CDP-alcohol phosphatidyltransferase family protein, partial [Pyrinomonadaceae bacterium]
MTKTAVLFVDSKKGLNGKTASCVPITDVPLVKRIVIDLRRAGMENIFVVMDERTDEIERILDDTRRTNFKRLVFTDSEWRTQVTQAGDADALVVTADRLSDYRCLESLASLRCQSRGSAVIAVDQKQAGEGRGPEKRYTPNDGELIDLTDVDASLAIREVGVYRFPVSAVSAFERYDAEYLSHQADEFKDASTAEFFDIGNGFVEVIDSRAAVRNAEQRIIRYVWKSTDGIHGRTNKRMILPLLRVLLRTSITPNMISLLGVIVSIISGYFYSRGHYQYAVLGGLFAVASSLLDHIDGSIARIKSKESAFGAHFDTICDYVFYISFGVGATVVLYQASSSPFYVWIGAAILGGTFISLLIISYRRTSFATNASTYAAEALKRIDETPNQILSLGSRVYFVARRPALPYYLLFFTVIGLLP